MNRCHFKKETTLELKTINHKWSQVRERNLGEVMDHFHLAKDVVKKELGRNIARRRRRKCTYFSQSPIVMVMVFVWSLDDVIFVI